jgi:hypothetical protein
MRLSWASDHHRTQVWSVPEAIEYMKHLVEFKPVFIEGQIASHARNLHQI